jgi:hypothetical protein
MNKGIRAGEYWRLKKNPDYIVLVDGILLGIVYFERSFGFFNEASAHLKKKDFLKHFEYSHSKQDDGDINGL